MVLLTGGGKSVLFTLPGLMREMRTSVVVVPFVALKDDVVRRIREAGVDCLVWEPALDGEEPETRAARVVLVSADTAHS